MRVLITGSEGTLGLWLRRELEHNGHEIWGTGRRHSARDRYLRADVAEARQLAEVFRECKPQVVYHLAAEFGRVNGQLWYEQMWRTNTIGTRNVIDQCLEHDAHMVMAGSSEAYGDAADLPGALSEDTLLRHVPTFTNEYALSKWANEKQIAIAQANMGLKATTLRFFNAYGPGEHYTPYRSVVCLFTWRLMHGMPIVVYQNYHRVFMYVSDWARTVARVATTPETIGQTINIGGVEYRAVEELVSMLQEKLGPIRSSVTFLSKEEANVTNKRPDVGKAQRLLGHECRVTLSEGLDRTIEWMREVYGHHT